jgi:hypothetical protein
MGIGDEFKNLSEDIVASYDARIKAIGTIVKETKTSAKNTHTMLKGFSAKHEEMSAAQARALAGFAADLTKNVGSMLKGFTSEHKDMAASLRASLEKNTKDIETYVKNKLREFSDAHAEMSEEMKEDLGKYVGDIVNGTRELLGGFRGEREKMGAHWQAMSATLAQKRGMKPVEVKAKSEAKTVEEAVAKAKARNGRKKGKGMKK